VGLLWLGACLNYVDRMTIFSVFPLLKKEMGSSDIALAMLGSTYSDKRGAAMIAAAMRSAFRLRSGSSGVLIGRN
jgi:hypothetical protein